MFSGQFICETAIKEESSLKSLHLGFEIKMWLKATRRLQGDQEFFRFTMLARFGLPAYTWVWISKLSCQNLQVGGEKRRQINKGQIIALIFHFVVSSLRYWHKSYPLCKLRWITVYLKGAGLWQREARLHCNTLLEEQGCTFLSLLLTKNILRLQKHGWTKPSFITAGNVPNYVRLETRVILGMPHRRPQTYLRFPSSRSLSAFPDWDVDKYRHAAQGLKHWQFSQDSTS